MSMILLILAGLAFRVLPHPMNFAPIGAIAIFASYRYPKAGVWVTLAALLAGDLWIGFYDPRLMAVVYGSLMLAGIGGLWLRKKFSGGRVIAASLAGSVLFYLTTNFAVWAFSAWYPHTWAGLMASYTLALPFFRNSILGDVFFTSAIFGAYALAIHLGRKKFRSIIEVEPAKIN